MLMFYFLKYLLSWMSAIKCSNSSVSYANFQHIKIHYPLYLSVHWPHSISITWHGQWLAISERLSVLDHFSRTKQVIFQIDRDKFLSGSGCICDNLAQLFYVSCAVLYSVIESLTTALWMKHLRSLC